MHVKSTMGTDKHRTVHYKRVVSVKQKHQRFGGMFINRIVRNDVLLDLVFDKAMSYRDASMYLFQNNGVRLTAKQIQTRISYLGG